MIGDPLSSRRALIGGQPLGVGDRMADWDGQAHHGNCRSAREKSQAGRDRQVPPHPSDGSRQGYEPQATST